MNIFKVVLFSSLVSGLAGCMAMRSNVSSDTSLRLQRQGFVSRAKPDLRPVSFRRILVVLKLHQPSAYYTQQFHRAFPPTYQVSTLILDPHQPAAHDEEISKRAKEWQSEVVLTVERTHKGSLVSLNAPDGDNFSQFAFDMRSVATGASFWRGTAAVPSRRGEYFPASAIGSRLVRDGVLTDKPGVQLETSLALMP